MPTRVPQCCAHAYPCMHRSQLASSWSRCLRGQHAERKQLASRRRAAHGPAYARQLYPAAAAAVDLNKLELDAPLIDADLSAVQAEAGASFDVRIALSAL